MLDWRKIESIEDVENIASSSKDKVQLIFKHSTRCSISSMSLNRLEKKWDINSQSVELHFLDLIRFRETSNFIAEKFDVYHQSPQVLLIKDEKCVFHCSHNEISADYIKEHL